MITSYSSSVQQPPLAKMDLSGSMSMRDVALGYFITLHPLIGLVYTNVTGGYYPSLTNLIFFLLFFHLVFSSIYYRRAIKMPQYLGAYLVFTLYCITEEIFMSKVWVDEGLIKYIYSNLFLMSFIGGLVIENAYFSKAFMKKMVKMMIIIVWITIIVSIIQEPIPLFLVDPTNPEQIELLQTELAGRNYSIYTYTFSTEIGFGLLSLTCILHNLGLMLGIRNYLWLALAGIGTFLNQSRWILLNFILMLFQEAFLSKKFIIQLARYGFIFLIGGVLGYFALLAVGVDVNAFIMGRVFDMENAGTRLLAIEVFAANFPRTPIFGTGGVYPFETLRHIAGRSSQIHVGFLALPYLYGIVGAVLWWIFIILLMKKLREVARITQFWGAHFSFVMLIVAEATLVEFGFNFHGLFCALMFHRFFALSIEQKKLERARFMKQQQPLRH